MFKKLARTLLACAISAMLGACNGGANSSSSGAGTLLPNSGSGSGTPILHVVLLVQENRSFNNLFATFPGATGTTVGEERVHGRTKQVTLSEKHLEDKTDLVHSYTGFLTAYNHGKMNGFNRILGATGLPERAEPYEYVNPADIAPYWTLASDVRARQCDVRDPGERQLPGPSRSHSRGHGNRFDPEPDRRYCGCRGSVGLRLALWKQDVVDHDQAQVRKARRAIPVH